MFRGIYKEDRSRSVQAELTYWNSIQDRKSPALFESYLKKYPDGRFADLARTQIEEFKDAPDRESVGETPPAAGAGSSRPAASAGPPLAAPTPAVMPVPVPPPTMTTPQSAPPSATPATPPLASQAPAPTCKVEFTTLTADKFQACVDYWSGKGYCPLTFAASKEADGSVVLTGAFEASVGNRITLLASVEKRIQEVAEFKRQNYRPDSVNIIRSPDGPRFTTIWAPVQGAYEARAALDQAELDRKLQQHGSDGLAIVDLVAFGPKDALRFHAVWNQSSVPARALLNLSAQDLRQQAAQLQQEGYVVGRVSSYRTGDGVRYVAILEKGPPESMFYVGMTGFDLQIRQNEAVSKGMRLHYISHAEGRFSAVWRK
jgi:hypothetical protein